MKLCKQLFILALFIFSTSLMATAQQANTVTGTVTDAKTGETIPGVNIYVKGHTQYGASTDIDGKFEISTGTIQNAILVFSFVGYKDVEKPVNNNSVINVSLEADAESLDEVVVVAYGTQRKVNLTGAVSSVSGKKIENRPVTNVSSSLAGLGAGISVMQTSGKPGSDNANIRMRGIGTLNSGSAGPLVIIDGIEGVLDAVNPNDIENISFLKDAASAAIYGSKAANGVILVTSKKGGKGRTTVTYNGLFSVAQPVNTYKFVTDYARNMELVNEARRNFGASDIFYETTIETWKAAAKNPNAISEFGIPNYVAYPNTDWGNEIFETNLVQSHNVTISGGSDNATYSLNLGYLDNPGIMAISGMKRYQMRANFESKVSDFLRVGSQTFAYLQNAELGNTTGAFTYLRSSVSGIYPMWDGKFGGKQTNEESDTANNPLAFLHGSQGTGTTFRLNTSWYAIVDLYDGLSFEGRLNYQLRTYEADPHSKAIARYNFQNNTIISPAGTPENMSVNFDWNRNWSYTAQTLLRYNKTFAKDHELGALLGFEQYYYKYDNIAAQKKGLIDETIIAMNSANEVISIGGSGQERATRSLFGRLNYAYQGKYLFETNFRYDGSSYFAKDNRWGFFPSFSAGWRISEEKFMENLKPVLSNLKLRASWGQLGNVTSGEYDAQSTYGKVSYSFGGKPVSGLRASKIGNPLLQWEQTNSTDLGLEASFLNNRLTFEFGWYNKYTEKILIASVIPITMGLIGAPTKNLGEVSNKGIELSLGWKSNIGKDFSYTVSGNFAYNFNRVEKFKGKLSRGWRENPNSGQQEYYTNIGDVSTGGDTRVLEDHLFNEYFLHTLYKGTGTHLNGDGTLNINGGPKDGMIRTEADLNWVRSMIDAGYKFMPSGTVSKSTMYYGDYIWADNNNDGTYGNENDRQFTGKSSFPKFNYGLNINMAWKNFDFTMQWAGSAGMSYHWYEIYVNGPVINKGTTISNEVANNHYYYNEANPNDPANNINAKYPRLRYDNTRNLANTVNLYDASYIKLKNLQIGYTFPKELVNKIKISNLRVFVSGENLLTITSYPGLDPEIGAGLNYPTLRQYAFGVNLTF